MPLIVIALAIAAVYGRTLGGSFLSWDDVQHFQLNPFLQQGDFERFWAGEYYGLYAPTIYSVWTALWKLHPQPVTFHALNIALHAINGALVWWLVRKIFASIDPWQACLATMIFCIHPLQVETVSWISGGRDLLSATLGLGAASLAIGAGPAIGVIATALFVLGLLAKPSLVMLPVGLWWIDRSRENDGRRLWNRGWLALWLAASASVVWATASAQSAFIALRVPQLAITDRILVALDSLGFYVMKTLVPWPLSANYGRTPTVVLEESRFWVPSVVLLSSMLVLYLIARKKGRATWAGAGFFVCLLAPVLGLVPFAAQAQSTVFDRYVYLSLIGATVLVLQLWQFLKSSRGLAFEWFHRCLVALICVFAVWSFERTSTWLDSRSVALDMVRYDPNAYEGLNNLANEEINAKNFEEATRLLQRARNLKPTVAIAWSNLAHAYWLQGRLDLIHAEIIPPLRDLNFMSANRLEPQALALMLRIAGRTFAREGRLPEAREAYCHAKRTNPIDPYLVDEVGNFTRERGLSCDR